MLKNVFQNYIIYICFEKILLAEKMNIQIILSWNQYILPDIWQALYNRSWACICSLHEKLWQHSCHLLSNCSALCNGHGLNLAWTSILGKGQTPRLKWLFSALLAYNTVSHHSGIITSVVPTVCHVSNNRCFPLLLLYALMLGIGDGSGTQSQQRIYGSGDFFSF